MSANQPEEPRSNATLTGLNGRPADRLDHFAAAPRLAAYAPAYTRLVRRLRVVLPVAGLVSLAVILLWPRIQAALNHPTRPTEQDRLATMVKGRFVGTDSHGKPYTVTYDTAAQPPGGGPIDMVNPLAEITLDSGRWVAVKAATGRYDQAAGTIDLAGHVELFHDDGYRFTTERAHVEFNKNLVWGDRAVEGHGPKGRVVARGFRVADKGDTIVFTGPVNLVLRPKAAQLPDAEGDAP